MKILLHGPSSKTEWWHNKVAKCSYCDTEVQLEKGDKVEEIAERRPNGKRWAQIKCPTCPEKIVLPYEAIIPPRPLPPPAPPPPYPATRIIRHL